MKTLILFRHAKAEPPKPGLGDHDRGLLPRGEKASSAMGSYIAAHGPTPDLILCSDARRARDTMEGMLATVGAKPAIEIEADLYLTEPKAILRRLRKVGDRFETVMIVGHNPALENLAHDLIARPVARTQAPDFSRLETKFPTAAIAVFVIDIDSWAFVDVGQAHLEAFVVPRDLAEA